MEWLKDEDLAKAMEMVPFAEAFVKAVKSAVKEKLKENPDAISGFKLRGGGSMTSYDAVKSAKILMDSGLLEISDLHKAMKFSLLPLVPIWADVLGVSKAEARKDLTKRLEDASSSRPKSPSIVKDK